MPDELITSETARAFHTPVEIVVRLNRLQERIDQLEAELHMVTCNKEIEIIPQVEWEDDCLVGPHVHGSPKVERLIRDKRTGSERWVVVRHGQYVQLEKDEEIVL